MESKLANQLHSKTDVIIDLQNRLLKTNNILEVYSIIPDKVREIIGSGICMTTMLDEKTQAMKVVAYSGLNITLDKIIKLLGSDPTKSTYYLKDMTPEEIEIFRSGRLEKLEGGLYALATRKYPKNICNVLEKLLGVDTVYTMGCVYNNIHYGGLIILTKQDITPFKQIIEQIINQAAILTQRLVVENELIEAREIAKENEIRYKTIADYTYDWEVFRDKDGQLIYSSPAFERIIGYKNEDYLSGKITFNDFIFEEDLEIALNTHKEAMNRKIIEDFVFRIVTKNNELKYLNVCSLPVFDNERNYIGVRISLKDITERKKTETELTNAKRKAEENELKYRKLFTENIDSCAIHKLIFDSNNNPVDYITTDVNPAFEKNLGINKSDVIGKKASEILPQEELKKWLDIFATVAISGKNSSYENYSPLNDKYFEGVVYSTEKNQFVVVFRNVTKRKKLEQERKIESYYLQKSQEIGQMGTWHVDMLNDKILWTKELYSIFGIPYNEVIKAETFFENVYPDDRDIIDLAWGSALLGKPFDIEHRIIVDGRIKWVREKADFEFDDKKNLIRVVGVAQDITNKKLTEQELIKEKEKAEESDRLKTAFLQNISHEIRTPMNAIIGFSKLLKRQNLTEEKRNKFISIVINSTQQLLSIITDILTIASIDSNQEKVYLTEVDLKKIFSELKLVFTKDNFNANVSLRPKPCLTNEQSIIISDKTKVTQILTNLIANALKFTDKGYVEYGCELKNNFLQFYVRDTGIGINKDESDKIFNRFYQAKANSNKKNGGTGLGLSICKEFVSLLGGEIWLESEIGKGTTFYFTIPYRSISKNQPSQNNTEIGTNDLTILVAEDTEASFLYIKEMFDSINCKVLHARNGKEAVDIFKSTPEIDIVLMDIRMPEMEGHVAAKIIKENNPDIPIIAQTAYALPGEIKKYGDVFNDYITKPLNEKILMETINKYLR